MFRRGTKQYIEGQDIQPCNLSKAAVESYAAVVAKKAGLQIAAPTTKLLSALVEPFGGRIRIVDLDEWFGENGSIFVHGPFDFDIVLPTYTSPFRDRFTVAHELGHYFLHSQQGAKPIVAYRRGSTRIEWEANWFAAGLLMPREKFQEVWRRTHDIRLVASTFGVSVDAASVRKEALGV